MTTDEIMEDLVKNCKKRLNLLLFFGTLDFSS